MCGAWSTVCPLASLTGVLCVGQGPRGAAAAAMADVDPETLLEWLSMGQGEERDLQLIALEQLCMLLLMSDNVDRCFERWVHRALSPVGSPASLDVRRVSQDLRRVSHGCARLMSRESNLTHDSDSNESSQSRVGHENQGYESNQSRITLIVI